jgi:hypothetical protein
MKTVFFDPCFDWQGHPLWAKVWGAVEQSSPFEASGFSPRVTELRESVLAKLLLANDRSRRSLQSDALAKFINDDQAFQRMKQTAVALLRRENSYGQLREIDSEVIFLRLVLNWQEALRQSGAQIVVFPVTPHFVDSFSLLVAARTLDIKTLWFQPSSLAPVMMPRFSLDHLPDLGSQQYMSESTAATIQRILGDQLAGAQAKVPKTYLERQAGLERSAGRVGGRWRAVLWTLKWLFQGRFPQTSFPPGAYRLPRLLDRLLQVVVPKISARSLRAAFSRRVSTHLPAGDYAVFALHYEPERTSVPEGGVESSQIEQIIRARELVPENMELVVREHQSQLSAALTGYRGRSPLAYDLIVADLGLTLDGSAPLADLLDGASVVFTGTGNMAVEAAMAGVPVIYFGFPWWAGMPGTYSYRDVLEGGLSISSLSGSDTETVAEFIEKRSLSEMLPGGSSETLEELERRFGKLGITFLEESGRTVADFLIENVLASG